MELTRAFRATTVREWLHAASTAGFRIKRRDGSTISPDDVDRTALRLMKAAGGTGVGVAILNHGKAAGSQAYGCRDVDRKLPLTENTGLAAPSFTKVAFS